MTLKYKSASEEGTETRMPYHTDPVTRLTVHFVYDWKRRTTRQYGWHESQLQMKRCLPIQQNQKYLFLRFGAKKNSSNNKRKILISDLCYKNRKSTSKSTWGDGEVQSELRDEIKNTGHSGSPWK